MQAKFRDAIGAAYGWKCAVTGCPDTACLEAAHLTEDGEWRMHNEVCDGVMLRADVHRLLDAGLLTFELDGTVRIAPSVRDMTLRKLNGAKLKTPDDPAAGPRIERLASRRVRDTP